MENDFLQLWRLVAELTDQLAQNRAITASLQAQAGSVKSAASHQGTGFALRRFNMHMTQEAFESELERMNAHFVQQNVELQNDNKQLASLLKEYEQALETVMSKFRTHAHAAQQHELSLTRHYESVLLSRETSLLASDLAASTAYSYSLARMSHLLRAALRVCGGENPQDEPGTHDETRDTESEQCGYIGGSGMDDWALERESELARLEYENYELRRMLGVFPPPSPLPSPPPLPSRWEAMLEGEQQHHGGLGMLISGPQNPEAGDDLTLRRQPSHTQGQPQISLEGAPQPHGQTQPLQIAFPPDAPLVTRKYGRRAGSGSGSFISGSGSFLSGSGVNDSNLTPGTGPFGTFRPPLAGGVSTWQDNTMAGPGERNLNLQGPGQDRDLDPSVRERDIAEGQQGSSTWDGITAMYLRGVGRRPQPRES